MYFNIKNQIQEQKQLHKENISNGELYTGKLTDIQIRSILLYSNFYNIINSSLDIPDDQDINIIVINPLEIKYGILKQQIKINYNGMHSHYNDGKIQNTETNRLVGLCDIHNGIILINQPVISQYNLQYNNYYSVTQQQYLCHIDHKKIKNTSNPTYIKDSQKYFTTIGLYNTSNQLVMIARLSRPLPVSDITVIVQHIIQI